MNQRGTVWSPIRSPGDMVVGFTEKATSVVAAVSRKIDIEERALVTIISGDGVPCGTGKTTFAKCVTHELGGILPGSQVEIHLGEGKGTIQAADAKMRICLSFDDDPKDWKVDDRYDALFENGGPLANGILLIDNAKDAAHAAPLIPRKGVACCVIVTSRNNLGDLNTLGFEISVSLTIGALSEANTVELLRLVRGHHPFANDDKATSEEEKELKVLAELTRGIPLAIMFVATLAQYQSMPFDDVVRHVKGDDSMALRLCAIYDALDKPLKRCLRRAADFSAPFTAEEFGAALRDGNVAGELGAKRSLGYRFELYELAAKNFLDNRDGAFSLHSVVRTILPRETSLLDICVSYIRTRLADGFEFDLSVLPEDMRNKVTCN